MEYKSKNLSQTKKIAQTIAQKSKKRIFALIGDLGSGKTAFTQSFLKALGVEEKITSPTFLLFRVYELKNNKKFHMAYHVDCYRIKDQKELLDLAIKDVLKNHRHVVLLEWADKIKGLLPKKGVCWIYFEHGKKPNERVIKVV